MRGLDGWHKEAARTATQGLDAGRCDPLHVLPKRLVVSNVRFGDTRKAPVQAPTDVQGDPTRGRQDMLHTPGTYPLIVNPLSTDASEIAQASVVEALEALTERVAFVHSRFEQPAIAEELITGRELYVSLSATMPGSSCCRSPSSSSTRRRIRRK